MSDGALIALITSGLATIATVVAAALARLSHRDGGLETRAQRLERENRALNDYCGALRAEARNHGHEPLPWPTTLTN